MEFDAKVLGKKIKLLRKEKELTQEQVGKKLKINRTLVSYYEEGRRIPKIKTLVSLATLFDTTVDFLLGGQNSKSKAETQITDFETLRNAINTYGKAAQEDVAIEEMSELIKAIIKNRRYNNIKTEANIREEMADVYIMLSQMTILYGDVSNIVNSKLQRLKQRLTAESCEINQYIEGCEDCEFCEKG